MPEKVDPEDSYAKREAPSGAWDAFNLNKLDRVGVRDENVSAVRGYWARSRPRLPARQYQFGVWISNVAHQPEAVWWASHQSALHDEIRNLITWRLERKDSVVPDAVRKAWRYLFDFWSDEGSASAGDWIEFSRLIGNREWDDSLLRRFAWIGRPTLTVSSSYGSGPTLHAKDDWRLHDLISLDVKYSDIPRDFVVHDDVLVRFVAMLRRILEGALQLESEIGGYGLTHLSPINPDNDGDIDTYSRSHGLSAWLLYYVSHFRRLITANGKAGRAEVKLWPGDDDTIFARLRIWSLGQSNLVRNNEFARALYAVSAHAFWDSHHARDLLLALSARWSALGLPARKAVEKRLLEGPPRWLDEENDDFVERRAWSIANRLGWLREQGCQFQFDFTRRLNRFAKLHRDGSLNTRVMRQTR